MGLYDTQNILMMFDTIINTDIGILYTMRDDFNNNEFINSDIFNKPENEILVDLLNRKDENVLSLVLKEKYINNKDSLLVDIEKEYYNKILEKSIFTDIITMAISMNSIPSINLTLCCKNVLEEQYIRKNEKYLTKFNIIICNDIQTLDITRYNSLFINKVSTLEKLIDNHKEQIIYLFNARYNLEEYDIGLYLPSKIIEKIPIPFINLITPYTMES